MSRQADDDYKALELYLQQAEEEITRSLSGSTTEVFSSASQPTVHNGGIPKIDLKDNHSNQDDLHLAHNHDHPDIRQNTPREITYNTKDNLEQCDSESVTKTVESVTIQNVDKKNELSFNGVQDPDKAESNGVICDKRVEEGEISLEWVDGANSGLDNGSSAQTATNGEKLKTEVLSNFRATAAQEAKPFDQDLQDLTKSALNEETADNEEEEEGLSSSPMEHDDDTEDSHTLQEEVSVKERIEAACNDLADVFGQCEDDNTKTEKYGDMTDSVSYNDKSDNSERCQTPTFIPSVDRTERIISHTLNQHRILRRSKTLPNFSNTSSPTRKRNLSSTQSDDPDSESYEFNLTSEDLLLMSSSLKSFPGETDDVSQSQQIAQKKRTLSSTAVQTSFDENSNQIESPKKTSDSRSRLISTGTNTTNSLERPKKRSSSAGRRHPSDSNRTACSHVHTCPVIANHVAPGHVTSNNMRQNYVPSGHVIQNQICSSPTQKHQHQGIRNHVHQNQLVTNQATQNQASNNHVTVTSPIKSPSKPTNFPEQFSSTMRNGTVVYDASPEMQVVVNSTSPVLLKRKPSNRNRQRDHAQHELQMYADDAEYAKINKDRHHDNKFMKHSMSRTWHGVTRRKWQQVYAPLMHSMLNNMNGNNGMDENCNLKQVGSHNSSSQNELQTALSQKTLLDTMHKKYCAYQYVNRLEIPYQEKESLPFMFKSSPPPPDRMKSRSWLIKHYAIPFDAPSSSSPESPDSSPQLSGTIKKSKSVQKSKSMKETKDVRAEVEAKSSPIKVETVNDKPEKCETGEDDQPTATSIAQTINAREANPEDKTMNVSPSSSSTDVQRLQPGKEDAEIEAVQACRWLKEAGFPQYAQMYEEGYFPVDILSVEKEHDFLDKDSKQALVRRLNTLNKCAAMRISTPSKKANEDSDDEDQCALSDKWKYQHNIRRWSRKDLNSPVSDGQQTIVKSSSSNDSLLTDQNSSSETGDSPVLDSKIHHNKSQDDYFGVKSSTPVNNNKDSMSTSFKSPTLKRAASERLKGAKNIIKRMESLKSSRRRRIVKNTNAVEISGPVIMDTADMQKKISHLNCKDLSPSENGPKLPVDTERETAILDTETSSPESSATSPVSPEPWSDETTNYKSPPSTKTPANNSLSLQELSDIETVLQSTTASISTPNVDSDLSHSDAVLGSSPRKSFSSRKNQSDTNLLSENNNNYILPTDHHRPGKFPKELVTSKTNVTKTKHRTGSFNLGSDSSVFNGTNSSASPAVRRRRGSADPRLAHRASYYDNVPEEEDLQTTQRELDLILNKLFQDINGLNKVIYGEDAADLEPPPSLHNSTNLSCVGGILDFDDSRDLADSNSNHDDHVIDDVISGTVSSDSTSDHDIPGEYLSHDDSVEQVVYRERRDSGVGSSLTRTPSDRRRYRIRWHSFQKSHPPSVGSRNIQITSLSVCQLMMLQKLSLCKLTGLIEKYSPNRSGWSWTVPRFMKRHKVPDYKEKNVFGVPLLVILQRTGQPLPQCMLHAMRFLRKSSKDALGIFRKSGVRTRIQKLKNEIEANPEVMDFDGLQAYDVADLLKQYFRELPECLLTNKLSEIFMNIFIYLPAELRIEAIQSSVLLLPDENREVLESLLLFLGDISSEASEHQMTASNLAVCFAPSLFNMGGFKNNPSQSPSPRRPRKNLGVPDTRELLEQKAAHECLTMMITECKKIFTISMNMLGRRFSYIEQGNPVTMEEYSIRSSEDTPGYQSDVDTCVQGLLKESRDKFRGWVSLSSNATVDVSFKKVADGHPLRLWKFCVDVEAPPDVVLDRIKDERQLWDEDLLQWRSVEMLDDHTEVFQYARNSMAPHPSRDFVVLRSWKTDLPKGSCCLVSFSVEHPKAQLLGGLRAVELASHYLIEPCGAGKSRITHITRVDLRGRTTEWYKRSFGHLCVSLLHRIKDSFKQQNTEGRESTV